MHGNLRKFILALGCVLLIAGGIVAWRATHPPLNDKQQIEANLEAARSAIENRNARGVTQYFASDFTWQGEKKADIHNRLVGVFIQSRDVQLHLSNVTTVMSGDSATTTGHYSISFKRTPDAWTQTDVGDFRLRWARRDGDWKIVKAEGGENLPD